jgi:AcrR family transcriptional regulator
MGIGTFGAPRRRPDSGGYPRGEETRARIIAAALQVFGEEGYTRASTRQIADAAGVNPPALQYYFDSKEGLHRACAEFIIERISRALSPSLRAADAAVASGDRRLMLEAIQDILEAMVTFSQTSEDVAGWSRFSGRGQVDDAGPAHGLIKDAVARPLHDGLAQLIGPLIGRAPDDDETRLRSIMVLSAATTFHVNRSGCLTVLCWPDFGDARGDAVKAVLRAHTRAALGFDPSPNPET